MINVFIYVRKISYYLNAIDPLIKICQRVNACSLCFAFNGVHFLGELTAQKMKFSIKNTVMQIT